MATTADIAELIPQLAPYALRTTLLNPTAGTPGVRESSVGGPLLWPASEEWPHCAQQGHWLPLGDEQGLDTVPMVPVLQLFARDVPELEFPDGTDVLQVVWCTLVHPADPAESVLPRLYWRRESDVLTNALLLDVPLPQEGEYDDDSLPAPCTLSPTTVVEYPNWDMPEALRPIVHPLIEELEEHPGVHYTDLACALRTKVGGYPAWTQPPNWPDCPQGHRMEHLLSINGDGDAELCLGDAGGVYLFVCRRCPGMPYTHRFDC
ncbi:DUF1963 domain-containing protein [Streptomyces sp. S6]